MGNWAPCIPNLGIKRDQSQAPVALPQGKVRRQILNPTHSM
jgi:hypothetical protein